MPRPVSRRLLLGMAAAAGCIRQGAAAAPEFVVGVEDLDYYPVYALRDGRYVGAARDILDAFAADTGLVLRYQPLPVKRLFVELLGGGVDLKFPDNPTWARDTKGDADIHYSAAVIHNIDGVMVRPERLGRGLEGFRVLGIVAGFTPFAWQSLIARGQVTVVENSSMVALQRQVLAGRIDGAYASTAVATHILENDLRRPGDLVFDAGLPYTEAGYSLSSLRHPAVITRFDAWAAGNAERLRALKQARGAEPHFQR